MENTMHLIFPLGYNVFEIEPPPVINEQVLLFKFIA